MASTKGAIIRPCLPACLPDCSPESYTCSLARCGQSRRAQNKRRYGPTSKHGSSGCSGGGDGQSRPLTLSLSLYDVYLSLCRARRGAPIVEWAAPSLALARSLPAVLRFESAMIYRVARRRRDSGARAGWLHHAIIVNGYGTNTRGTTKMANERKVKLDPL